MASELFKLMGTIAIDATDATQKIEAVISAGADLEAKLNGIGTNADTSFGSKSGFDAASIWLGNVLTELTQKAERLGEKLWNTGFNMNLSEESWIASFKTYLGGDLEEATALVEKLKQFAIDTPLTMQEVMAQATQLLATGTEPEKLIETLTMLGDVSRGDMTYFSKISTAYWQIMTTGRLLAQDANQLTQAGVPVWQLVADYFNMIERDGRTDWTKGLTKDLATQAALQKNPDLAISSEELYGALLFATSDNGMYFNAMNNAMDTTKGKLQKLQDAFTQFAASLTQPFTDTMGSETLDKLTTTFDNFTAWAEENPEVLKSCADALSNLATNGLEVLLGGLRELLTFWNDNQDMFNGFLMVLGGLAIKSGKFGMGAALITAGGYNVWDDWLKEQQAQMSALTSDVDLGFIKQQLDYQGKSDQWEAYLANWKAAQLKAGYDEETIENYVATQLANYKPYTDDAMKAVFEGYQGSEAYNNGGMGALDAVTALIDAANGGEKEESPLPVELQYLQFRRQRDYVPDTSEDGTSGSSNSLITQLIAVSQQLSTLRSEVSAGAQEGVAAGFSGATVTCTVNTGNVLLDGVIVGKQTAPYVNFQLGTLNRLSSRG